MITQSEIDELLKDFLSASDAAKLLHITPRTVQTAAHRDQIPGAIRTGRDVWIPKSWVAARKKKHGTGPIPQADRPWTDPNSNGGKLLRQANKGGRKSHK